METSEDRVSADPDVKKRRHQRRAALHKYPKEDITTKNSRILQWTETSLFWKRKKRKKKQDEEAASKSATFNKAKVSRSGTKIKLGNIVGIVRHPRQGQSILFYSSNNTLPYFLSSGSRRPQPDFVFFFAIKRMILLDGYQFSSLPFS